jgi:Fic family protein
VRRAVQRDEKNKKSPDMRGFDGCKFFKKISGCSVKFHRGVVIDLKTITLWFMVCYMKIDKLTDKKKSLDGFRPLPDALVHNLDDWFRVELTYTSNAIEGNTLTRRETALVVEKGLTVGGKSLTEHLEATNHARALDWVKEQVKRKPTSLTEKDILHIHDVILKGIDDANAGHYRSVPVRISGSAVVLPNPRKVPDLMQDFAEWLSRDQALHTVELAAEAHYRLVTIHPFVDGNGRSARLLMNMILLMSGYPAAIIRKRDRLAYIGSLEKAQLGGSKNDYFKIIAKAVDRSLDIYLKAAAGEDAEPADSDQLLKIGELAKQVGESNATIRHWTKEGLLQVADVTEAGYQLYAPEMTLRIKQIHSLKEQRFTLQEIKEKLS